MSLYAPSELYNESRTMIVYLESEEIFVGERSLSSIKSSADTADKLPYSSMTRNLFAVNSKLSGPKLGTDLDSVRLRNSSEKLNTTKRSRENSVTVTKDQRSLETISRELNDCYERPTFTPSNPNSVGL